MQRRCFVRLSATALISLLLPRLPRPPGLRSTHDVYHIGVKKGLLGRGRIVGHLQVIADSSRYSISLWAEEITKKILFLTIGNDTEKEAMNLVLDEQHVNPLRIYFTAFGRLKGDVLLSDGIVVTDKKDGKIISRLSIDDTMQGGALATYSTIGHSRVSRTFAHRPTDPLTGLLTIGRGQTQVSTVSVRTRDKQIDLDSRTLSATSVRDQYVLLRTGPDPAGRFWDFRSDTRLRVSNNRISRMKIDRYSLFSSIDIRHDRHAPLVDLDLEHAFAERL